MRTRIRSIKPEFFQYEALYDAEQQCGLPLRLAFSGLWCVADREGRFEWRPRALKANVLPYDQVDFDAVLDQLARCGCILKYIVAGREYGVIPSWGKHQVIHHTERASDLPAPSEVTSNGADTVDSPLPHGDITGISRRGREGKGRERKGKENTKTPECGTNHEAIQGEATAPHGAGRDVRLRKQGVPTWLTLFGEAWQRHCGDRVPWKPLAQQLAPLCKKYEPIQVLNAFRGYLTNTEPRYASPARFAATSAQWGLGNGGRPKGPYYPTADEADRAAGIKP